MLMTAAVVPAFALAATAAFAAGDYKNPSASTKGTTTTTPATTNDTTSSMKSGMTTSIDQRFDRLDVNHDGKLSATEAAADPKVHSAWKKIDADNKGSVSKAEFQAHASDIR
jgi:FlaG/FlaF family flagellin (archaellin)